MTDGGGKTSSQKRKADETRGLMFTDEGQFVQDDDVSRVPDPSRAQDFGSEASTKRRREARWRKDAEATGKLPEYWARRAEREAETVAGVLSPQDTIIANQIASDQGENAERLRLGMPPSVGGVRRLTAIRASLQARVAVGSGSAAGGAGLAAGTSGDETMVEIFSPAEEWRTVPKRALQRLSGAVSTAASAGDGEVAGAASEAAAPSSAAAGGASEA